MTVEELAQRWTDECCLLCLKVKVNLQQVWQQSICWYSNLSLERSLFVSFLVLLLVLSLSSSPLSSWFTSPALAFFHKAGLSLVWSWQKSTHCCIISIQEPPTWLHVVHGWLCCSCLWTAAGTQPCMPTRDEQPLLQLAAAGPLPICHPHRHTHRHTHAQTHTGATSLANTHPPLSAFPSV